METHDEAAKVEMGRLNREIAILQEALNVLRQQVAKLQETADVMWYGKSCYSLVQAERRDE